MHSNSWWATLLALGFLACTPVPTSPQVPARLEALPPEYAVWWREVEQCSGRVGRLNRVRFWVIPGGAWTDDKYPGLFLYGLTDGDDVYLAEGQERAEWIVKHEMLHVLDFRHPDSAYPPYPWPFVGCADV